MKARQEESLQSPVVNHRPWRNTVRVGKDGVCERKSRSPDRLAASINSSKELEGRALANFLPGNAGQKKTIAPAGWGIFVFRPYKINVARKPSRETGTILPRAQKFGGFKITWALREQPVGLRPGLCSIG